MADWEKERNSSKQQEKEYGRKGEEEEKGEVSGQEKEWKTDNELVSKLGTHL